MWKEGSLVTRKDYVKLAVIIKQNKCSVYKEEKFLHEELLVLDLCAMLEADNPHFDRQKFMEACSGR